MASFERLYIPRNAAVSNEVLLAGKRYRIIKRCL